MAVWIRIRRLVPWVGLAASVAAMVAAVSLGNVAADRDQRWYWHTLDTACAKPLWPLPDNSSLGWAMVAMLVGCWVAALAFTRSAFTRGERAPTWRQGVLVAVALAVATVILLILTRIGVESAFLLFMLAILMLWIAYLVAGARGRWAAGVAVVYLLVLLPFTWYTSAAAAWIARAGDPPELGLSGDGPECGCC